MGPLGELGELFNPGMRHEIEERRSRALRREEEGNARDGDVRIDLDSGVAVISTPRSSAPPPRDAAPDSAARDATSGGDRDAPGDGADASDDSADTPTDNAEAPSASHAPSDAGAETAGRRTDGGQATGEPTRDDQEEIVDTPTGAPANGRASAAAREPLAGRPPSAARGRPTSKIRRSGG